MQCIAPLQSWGTQSDYIVRDTGREPSKSGIIGLLCAALGRRRDEAISDLARLKMGVRVDQEGKILRDFHTITDKLKTKPSTTLSTRYYLADAMFLVGLEGEYDLLKQLHEALRHPCWLIFLGRKSCPPSRPPYLPEGLVDKSLCQALEEYPWLGQDKQKYESIQSLRLVYDDNKSGNEFHQDHPINFVRNQRQFHPRRTTTTFIARPHFEPQLSYPLLQEKETAS
jgi:CRISPR system Cascade subunit CasD